MRPKVDYRSSSKECYNIFRVSNPKIEISYNQFKQIIKTFNEMLIDYVLETGDRVRIPFGFGEIAINKWKPKRFKEHDGKQYINLPVDWAQSKKLGRYSYHINAHTDGFRFQWKWFKKDARFECSKIYAFKPNRINSRKLAQYIKKKDSKYPNIYKEWPKKWQ
jgi:nucleoid DNA-binding protein